jgi:hypothetical protein
MIKYLSTGGAMKKIILFFLIILLTGCTNYTNFELDLKDALNKESSLNAISPDNNKTYFRYYLEPCIGLIYSNQTSNIFLYNNVKFIMNLNVASVINDKYYSNEFENIQLNQKYKLFSFSGEYTDYKNKTYPYYVDVFKVNDVYYLKLNSKYVSFYVNGNEASLINISRKMLQIAKSIDIYEEEILSDFSSKEIIEYTKEEIQLFDVIVPVNGKIQDILDGEDIRPDGYGDDYNEEDRMDIIDDYQTDDYETD